VTKKITHIVLLTAFFSTTVLNTYGQCPSKIEVSKESAKTLKLTWHEPQEKPSELESFELDGLEIKGSFDKTGAWRSKQNSVFTETWTSKERAIFVYGVECKYKNGIFEEPPQDYLISFTGQNVNNQILMTWIVMKSAKDKRYEIERRLSDDWVIVDSVSTLKPKTKASSVMIFEYLDQTPPSGDLVYRVKCIKPNNKFTISELITVSNFGGKQTKLTRIDPIFRFEKETQFEVMGDNGQLLFKGKGQFIDFSQIGMGTFSVKYSGNSTKVIFN